MLNQVCALLEARLGFFFFLFIFIFLCLFSWFPTSPEIQETSQIIT